MNVPRCALAALVVLTPAVAAMAALAQSTAGAISLQIDMSPTAAGMGRAGAAQWWGEATNDWINPALLATTDGVRYDHWRSLLVPTLATDVYMTVDRWRFGGSGIGVLVSGRGPGAFGGATLDYGINQQTDENGEVLSEFRSFEAVQSWGVALSAAGLLDAVRLDRDGSGSRIGDHLDVGAGFASHHVDVNLAPPEVIAGGTGHSHSEDWGVYARFTPYNSIAGRSRLRDLDRLTRRYLGGVRIDASFGHSVLGANDSVIAFVDEWQADPMPHSENTGWALHAATGFPRVGRGDAARWIARTFTPLLSWGFVSDHRELSAGNYVVRRTEAIESHGWEVQIAHVWSIRNGFYSDPVGTVRGTTRGWSLAIPLAGAGEVRFDRAKVPQSKYLTQNNEVTRTGVSVVVHPLRAWRWMR